MNGNQSGSVLRPLLLGLIFLQSIACVHIETSSPNATGAGVSRPVKGISQAYDDASRPQLADVYGNLPMSFEANNGQVDAEVKFLSRGSGYTLFLTPNEAVLMLQRLVAVTDPDGIDAEATDHAVLRLQLIGANPNPEVIGQDEQQGKINYFRGSDTTQWRTNIPTYASVIYKDIYPSIDLVYYGNQRRFEYDFIVAPGADPNVIRLAFQGVDEYHVDASGNLVLQTAGGEVIQRAPIIYQQIDGIRQPVNGRYLIVSENQIGFEMAAYDSRQPLIIDPVLEYSTYLGGTNSPAAERGFGIAVDAAGYAYLTGVTGATDFPTQNPFQGSYAGGSRDAFVTKLNPEGNALVYSTYLGGSGDDNSLRGDIVVDASGNAYVTGGTNSDDFPTTPGAFQTVYAGGGDAFVTKLNSTGSALVYSTYLGGSGAEDSIAIALDASANAYVTGVTTSNDFPTANPFQESFAGGSRDAFVAKLNASGSGLAYSTYLGERIVERK